MSRCPHCGLEKSITASDLLWALVVDVGGARTNHDFKRCQCKDGLPEPVFWKANDITEEESEEMGELTHRTWRLHHAPDMTDCIMLDYGYRIVNDRVIVDTGGGEYYDITEEVLERTAP